MRIRTEGTRTQAATRADCADRRPHDRSVDRQGGLRFRAAAHARRRTEEAERHRRALRDAAGRGGGTAGAPTKCCTDRLNQV